MAGKVQFLQRGASCIHRGLCFSIPPASYFLEAELLSAFSCGFSLMKHLGLRSKNRVEVKRGPCHQSNPPTANWKRGPLCPLTAGSGCLPRTQLPWAEGLCQLIPALGLQNENQSWAISFPPHPAQFSAVRSPQNCSGLSRGTPRFLAAGCAGRGAPLPALGRGHPPGHPSSSRTRCYEQPRSRSR